MEKFKKVLLIAFGLILVMSILPRDIGAASTSSESNVHKKIVFQQEEIKDMDVLYEKAKKEKKENKKFKHKALLKGQKGSIEIDTISTSQLLEVSEVNGVREEYYAVTTFAKPTSEDLQATAATASKSDYKYDGTYSVRLNSTFYYTNTTTGGVPAVDLHHAVASYTILDSQVTVTKAEMWMGASGWASGGYVTQVTGRYVVSGYRSAYPPTSWVPVANDPSKNFGVNSNATIKRGGSTWSVQLINQL